MTPSVIFRWNPSDMEELLATCERDADLKPLIERHVPKGSRILEAGCGLARWVRYMKDRGWNIAGLEYSRETVGNVNSAWPDLDVRYGDCAAAPFEDSSFDCVLSFGVVEHWPEGPQKPLLEIRRLLRSGGIAIITAPCMNTIRKVKRALWWDEIIRFPRSTAARLIKGKKKPMTRLSSGYRYHVFPAYGEFHEYRMTPAEFEKEVREAGLQIVEHVPTAHLEGVYHELNPYGLLIGYKNHRFFPSRFAAWLDGRLARTRYFHPHFQAIIARKP